MGSYRRNVQGSGQPIWSRGALPGVCTVSGSPVLVFSCGTVFGRSCRAQPRTERKGQTIFDFISPGAIPLSAILVLFRVPCCIGVGFRCVYIGIDTLEHDTVCVRWFPTWGCLVKCRRVGWLTGHSGSHSISSQYTPALRRPEDASSFA